MLQIPFVGTIHSEGAARTRRPVSSGSIAGCVHAGPKPCAQFVNRVPDRRTEMTPSRQPPDLVDAILKLQGG
jgi:hypothetical protein